MAHRVYVSAIICNSIIEVYNETVTVHSGTFDTDKKSRLATINTTLGGNRLRTPVLSNITRTSPTAARFNISLDPTLSADAIFKVTYYISTGVPHSIVGGCLQYSLIYKWYILKRMYEDTKPPYHQCFWMTLSPVFPIGSWLQLLTVFNKWRVLTIQSAILCPLVVCKNMMSQLMTRSW